MSMAKEEDPLLTTSSSHKALGLYYCLVGNIPKTFHSCDLRNYFSKFVEDELFDCFHFRHRPQVISITEAHQEQEDKHSQSQYPNVIEVLCGIARFSTDAARQSFISKYHGKYWVDKDGDDIKGRCVIQQVKMNEHELKKFTRELYPPKFMPRGNVGTSTKYFLNQIKECKLPPSLIKKLALEFPAARRYKKYSKVPFDYGTEVVEDKYSEDLVTGRGHSISEIYVPKLPKSQESRDYNSAPEKYHENSDEDNDRCEEWERHESLHEDVTSQERLKERLYEEEIELVWEKGGPGIVWYTDAQYWEAQKGGFDEQTSDDWDVDMEGYYTEGGGDKDARDSLEMRKSARFQKGLEEFSVFKKKSTQQKPTTTAAPSWHSKKSEIRKPNEGIGKFEEFTKGIGRKVMESHGWKHGLGLGKQNEGITEALDNEGKIPSDKRGIGYYGENVDFGKRRTNTNQGYHHKSEDEEEKVVIGTIYDRPEYLDKQEPTLRSNNHTFIKRYKN